MAEPIASPPDPRGDLLVKATIGIVVLIIVLVFALVFMSMFGLKADQSLMTLVGQVVATTLGLGGAVWAWQFASSKGSADKTAALANSTPIIVPPTVPAPVVPGPAVAAVITTK